ncbi:LytR C-terminal domain-containing protein [Nanchangia anserum]|nr:LytR C-terminal domain-containing protein [Nanchangia anserum]
MQQPRTPRETYVMRRRQRETLIFTWLSGGLAVLALIGILIGFNIVPFPFFTDFASGDKIAQAGDVPCPTGEGQPVAPERVKVTVLNGTTRSGLASDVSAGLKERGFAVASASNAPNDDIDGTVVISSGPTGVNSAYTVALAFPDATLVLDSRLDPDVTVTIGAGYDQMVAPNDFRKSLDAGLAARPSCMKVSLE